MNKTAFVKISGDLISREDVLDWIRVLTQDYFVVVCSGGGTQINKAFEERGIPVVFGPLGREIERFEDRQFAREILEKNQAEIQDLLQAKQIQATVVIPVLDIGSVLCHVNGDVYVLAAYLGFDALYVLTLEDRVVKKTEEFKMYPKVTVVGFD
ncbi:MAG: hypothetical protein UT41_C0001G0292 [Candidatus Wolfebacteria bacterium GW2011_GWC2_39_22]|uniref:Uncharacterized protein n=1 Tax=Candidatus Wolfebacteria bacterium GW2011_GWC2_39_22 TaxID=1619013 RepID=A0A0G0NBA0_9BACT|nr:MAG: hypothetical protein UT41_C0001G0292 [Candidatus Wolfebacteria bacterium GW2011_GWC2_39_22]HBI25591.1 hypothetical protein [Candidatus Wolfebacteria bacterium]